MNILFFCEDAVIYKTGGVQNVTALWRDYFINKGNNVHIVYRKNDTNLSPDIPQSKLPFKSHSKSRENIDFLIQLIKRNEIEIVVNQAAQGPLASYVCTEACRHTQTPLISIVHNSPNALLKRILDYRLFSINRHIKSAAKYVLPFIIRHLPRYGTIRQVKHCSKLVLLAPEYITEYEDLYIGQKSNKLIALPNPVITANVDMSKIQKENIALFVGRLSEQKAIDHILRIWKIVESKCNKVKLYIVGDGELETELKNLARDLQLERVYFEGNRNPVSYYERSKVFLMTSIYEGLPMTLLECQQYGVVPVVMESFSAAKGILGENLRQFVIPQNEDKLFCDEVIELLKNEHYYKEASLNCLQNIERFSLDTVAPQFERLIKKNIEIKNM